MLYLLAAIIGSSSLVILLKMFELKRVNLYVGITVNYILGAILAFIFTPSKIPFDEIIHAPWLIISMVIGALFMLSFIVYGISAQRSGVAITTISGRAAVVIPVIFAFTVLGEQATTVKILMLALILLSMFLILRKDNTSRGEGKHNIWLLVLPISVFLFNGINDTLVQYAHREMIPSGDLYPIFTGTMFIGGSITGVICYLISCLKHPHIPTGRDLLWGSILGFMNWICMIGVFYALAQIQGSIFYPLYYTGAILISTVVGVWAFKEKLSKINYIGIAVAVIAIAVLSTQ